MIAILSPAKTIRTDCPFPPGLALTKPQFPAETVRLWERLRQLAPWELESAFKINPQLAMRAACDFQDFDWDKPGTPALFSYAGLAFTNLGAADFTSEDVAFANDHLRILSGFYGLVRPCDGIQPYRLEMGCKLKFGGQSLYRFWGDKLYRSLFAAGQPVINLASREYAKAVEPYLRPGDRFITCDFVTWRNGRLTTIATAAKMARGQMARWMVRERLTEPEQLKGFDWDGYAFVPERSSTGHYCFQK